MPLTTDQAVSSFGLKAKEKLSNPSIPGEPEEQLRGPFEALIVDMSHVAMMPKGAIVVVGETSINDLKIRPDFAVAANKALVGFIELKAPGKGGDPRRFRDKHDKAQWQKLQSLPNLMYSDGNEFSLWQDGDLVGEVVRLQGDIATSGRDLEAPPELLTLFERFLSWQPIAPRNVKELARVSARLCRLLRDEVTEQLGMGSEALTSLAEDWRRLLFPQATDEDFADGYAQAVTFGMLMARAKAISLSGDFENISKELAKSSSIIGTALRLLTDNAENRETLKTSLGALRRVLDVVNWPRISKGNPEAWLYFYEDFLEIYDNALRKETGSYYTPPEVVGSMVRLVDEVLRSPRFGLHAGIASSNVTLADPAMGTGTFMLEVLRRVAATVEEDEGAGAVGGVVSDAVNRLISFEMQLGPFAVAQLRLIAELTDILGTAPQSMPHMFVTNTLGDPSDDEGWIPDILAPIAKSRRDANKIKRNTPITVVIGNPPYREKAKGMGGWIEGQTKEAERSSPLAAWKPPTDWGVGAHVKHLRNLYIYFWRWATWKVFDHHPDHRDGIVCFITVAGFLNGPGFQKMRSYLRETCDDIWVIYCSPEGHQPDVNTRIFQGVQQPVCIVLASRSAGVDPSVPAVVHFHGLSRGDRQEKFQELGRLTLSRSAWTICPSEWRAPFLPSSDGAWSTFPKLEDLFIYNGSGVMPGRTWIIAPDADSLNQRWSRLLSAPMAEKEALFHPHLRNGKPGDKHVHRRVDEPLAGYRPSTTSVADETDPCIAPVRYGFRSFDRQWIIPDSRVINRPNPKLWEVRSNDQVYLTAPADISPTNGPALSFSAVIADLHHYNGRGGRIFPLWLGRQENAVNIKPRLLTFLLREYGADVTAVDVMAYIAAVAAHPAYTTRFQKDLSTPGLRIPFTADPDLFAEVVATGRRIIWLHTFGERMVDPDNGCPARSPRMPIDRRPHIPADGAISTEPDKMPDVMEYDATRKRLLVGEGFVENVSPGMWNYEVSGKRVLAQWFSYRRKNRERPIIGTRRAPSTLGSIQPDHWLAEYTSELLNVLNVLGLLLELEPVQAMMLERICQGAILSTEDMQTAGAFEAPSEPTSIRSDQHSLV